MHELSSIPYDFTIEVKNRFKGLDLVDRIPEESWTEVRDIVQEVASNKIPKRSKSKKAKWQNDLLKSLQEDAVRVLLAICQQI